MTPQVVSLFCGAGGMDFGLSKAGFETSYALDIDRDSTETFRQEFRSAEVIHGDLREFLKQKKGSFPKCDLVVGGYPCQPFSMGGSRNPTSDSRSNLFLAFAEALNRIRPKAFIAENVSGLTSLGSGVWFHKQLDVFRNQLAVRYRVTHMLLNAADYGIPQFRKRVFIVGIRAGLREEFVFPEATHCDMSQSAILGLDSYLSHGEVIKKFPANPDGEYYELEDEAQNFSWYYLSRNRRKHWSEPSYTIVANPRHTPIHPASPSMELVWSNLKDGYKQGWKFTRKYDHHKFYQDFPKLRPRRLSWREAAAIQTFPKSFEPIGNLASKYKQVGNAVPPKLMEVIGLKLRNYIG